MELAVWILLIVVICASVVLANKLRNMSITLVEIWRVLSALEERIRTKDEDEELEKRRDERRFTDQP